MALSIDEANTVQSEFYDGTITQMAYEKDALYAVLKARKKVLPGGNHIQIPFRYKKLGLSKWVDAREQMTFEEVETRTAGRDEYKYCVGHAMISWDERVKNTGKSQIVDLLADKNIEMQDDLYDAFVTAVYATTQATKKINSLLYIVDSSNSHLGISPTDFTEWASVEDASTTELTLYGSGSLSYMFNQATFGKDQPTVVYTTRDLWSKIESMIEPNRRYYNADMKAKIGFTSLVWHDADILAAAQMPAGYLLGLDIDKYEMRYHPDFDMKTTGWKDLFEAGFPNAMANVVSWAGQLICRQRNTSFKYSALDYTK